MKANKNTKTVLLFISAPVNCFVLHAVVALEAAPESCSAKLRFFNVRKVTATDPRHAFQLSLFPHAPNLNSQGSARLAALLLDVA